MKLYRLVLIVLIAGLLYGPNMTLAQVNLQQGSNTVVCPVCPGPVPSDPCTYTYSDWTPVPCPPSGVQSRKAVSSTPPGCSGLPVLSQPCPILPTNNMKAQWDIAAQGGGMGGSGSGGFLKIPNLKVTFGMNAGTEKWFAIDSMLGGIVKPVYFNSSFINFGQGDSLSLETYILDANYNLIKSVLTDLCRDDWCSYGEIWKPMFGYPNGYPLEGRRYLYLLKSKNNVSVTTLWSTGS